MTTHAEPNVTVIGIDGNSDELDRPIKAVFDDKTFATQHRVTSINSINLVR
jgi:threonine synthase